MGLLMSLLHFIRAFLIKVFVLLLFSACGGGSSGERASLLGDSAQASAADSSNQTSTGDNGKPSAVTRVGVITGFGSVIVNGVRYNTDAAEVLVNGVSVADLQDLRVGMRVVMVYSEAADFEQPIASQIAYRSDIEGEITSINRVDRILVVAGIEVHYNDLTRFWGVSPDALVAGDVVEVSGHFVGDLPFLATFIELENAQHGLRHTVGYIADLDDVAQTFSLGSLIVDYSGIATTEPLANGQLVWVSGTAGQGGLIADAVTPYHTPIADLLTEDFDASVRHEISGLVSGFSDDRSTIFVDGIGYPLASELRAAVALYDYVELHLSSAGEVVFIESEDDFYRSDGSIKGLIETVDLDAQSVTVNQTPYYFSTTTRFEDDRNERWVIADIEPSQAVEISYALIDGQRLIQRIELEYDDELYEQWELKGLVSSITDKTLSVDSVPVDISGEPIFLLQNMVVTRTQFLQVLTTTSIVEVEGYFDGENRFVAQKIEAEGESYNAGDFYSDHRSDAEDRFSDDAHFEYESDDDYPRVTAAGSYIEFEGYATSLLAEDDSAFELGGTTVRLDVSTACEVNDRYVDCRRLLQALAVGRRVEVEGIWLSSGEILALEVELE